jgi:protease II
MKKYEIKTVNIPSVTGDLIPATILSKKLSNMYPHKLVLKVYGFYGLSNEVTYDNMNYALL